MDIYRIIHNIFSHEGLERLLPPTAYLGHGIGLAVNEYPFIHNSEDVSLKSGMVLAIEPWTYDKDDISLSVNIEDIVLVRKNGCETLSDIDRDIFVV